VRISLVTLAATYIMIVRLSSGADAGSRVLSPFGATTGPEGYPRTEGAHQGVDLAAAEGTPVLAPAAEACVRRTER